MKEEIFKFELGKNVIEKLTGFTGVITGRAQYITGCNQYHLQPSCGDDNKFPEGVWSDEGRIELTDINGYDVNPKDMQTEGDPGCDTPNPSRR